MRAMPFAVVLALLSAASGPGAAQNRSVLFRSPVVVSAAERPTGSTPVPGHVTHHRDPVLGMAAAGFLGGAVGGALVAVPLAIAVDRSGCEVCTGIIYFAPVALLTHSIGQGLGVHLANRRGGNLLADIVFSALGTLAGAGVGALAAGADGAVFGGVSGGLAASIWTELRTSR